MMNTISINDGDKIFSALSYYCPTLIDLNLDCNITFEGKIKLKDKMQHLLKKLSDEQEYTFEFRGLSISLKIIQYGTPVGLENSTAYHKTMKIQIESGEKNMEILEELFVEAGNYYMDNILDKQKVNSKTTIYVWDEYWETVEKRNNRKISTVYLGGKEYEVLDELKQFLSDETEKEYNDLGIPYKYNVLFHGYPGTGKTTLIYSIASELGMDIALLPFTCKMTDVDFMRAMRRIPNNTLLVLEDIDTLFEARKKHDENKNNISFSGLLNSLDGIAHIDKQIIFMTTNCFMVLDKALVRPGRIDMNIEFKYANKKQIKTMFQKFLPTQKDKFDLFYEEIRNINVTTAMLQQFLFSNRKSEDIIENIDELKKLSRENNYEKKDLYT